MTNESFYQHIIKMRRGDENLTKAFVMKCNKEQFEWIKDNFEGYPLDRIVLILMRFSGKCSERRNFELTNVDTSTWD